RPRSAWRPRYPARGPAARPRSDGARDGHPEHRDLLESDVVALEADLLDLDLARGVLPLLVDPAELGLDLGLEVVDLALELRDLLVEPPDALLGAHRPLPLARHAGHAPTPPEEQAHQDLAGVDDLVGGLGAGVGAGAIA